MPMSLRQDLRSSNGASAVEYALLISAIAAVVAVAVFALGKVVGPQLARGGACLTSAECTDPAAPLHTGSASPDPSSSTAATPPTPTPTATSPAPAPAPTPRPSSTRRSGGKGDH